MNVYLNIIICSLIDEPNSDIFPIKESLELIFKSAQIARFLRDYDRN